VQDTDFSNLKLIIYGASPIPLDLLRRSMETFKCGFAQTYGLTETSGGITWLPPEDHDPNGNERMRSCGKPHSLAEIRVVDATGRVLPVGEVGEIICRSPQNMKGYWNLPDATASTVRGEWLHTGDAGYLDADGYIYIHDRVKDLIVSGGENIYPAEVESVLFGHPAIADVAVIGVPDDTWGEAVKAVVVKKDGAEVTAEEIVSFARERMAHFKAPRSVDFVAALPRNPSGKILKRELRAPYWEGRGRQVN
jgi:acyl-CoA synthetase (AMP-forming)/AMP-acid ligase II